LLRIYYKEKNSLIDKIKNIFNSEDLNIRSRPLMLICETVNICNHNCIICPYSSLKRDKQLMKMDVFRKVLRDYSDMGGGYLSLTPMVGDIFFDKFLPERLEMISDYPLIKNISVTTNAVCADNFSDESLKYIINQFDRFHISVYGLDENEYFTMTQRKTYSKMIHSIEKILDITEKENIVFGFRLLKNRSGSEIETWFEDNFGKIYPYSYTNMYSNWGCSLDHLVILPWDASWNKKDESDEPCLIPLLGMQIFPNGDVSFCACADFECNPELYLGNIIINSLGEIYNSEKTKNLWHNLPKVPDICKNCSFYKPISDLKNNENIFESPLDMVGG
jgi:radical SAM protein with 4Fe4S-binding SPASM domain